MSKMKFSQYVCRPFCSFFREGVNEELACQGALAVESLIASGRLRPEALPAGEDAVRRLLPHDNVLDELVCRQCPFRADDCDFRAATPIPGANPCGGYLLLSLLLDRGAVSRHDLQETGSG